MNAFDAIEEPSLKRELLNVLIVQPEPGVMLELKVDGNVTVSDCFNLIVTIGLTVKLQPGV